MAGLIAVRQSGPTASRTVETILLAQGAAFDLSGDIAANTAHRQGDGSDHADVALNSAHRIDLDNPHQVGAEDVADGIVYHLNQATDLVIDIEDGLRHVVEAIAAIKISVINWYAKPKATDLAIIGINFDAHIITWEDTNQGAATVNPLAGFAVFLELSTTEGGDIYNMWQVSNDQHVILESDVIINGDFATDSDWNKGVGWIIAGGVASQTGSAFSELIQDPVVASGEDWFLDYDVTAIDGTVRPLLGGQTGVDRLAIGSYSEKIVSGAINTYLAFSMKNVGAKTCSITNVRLRKGL